MKVKGKILALPTSNIDTDQIIPARHLTGISKTGYGKHLLEDLPDNPLDRSENDGAKVIVTYENFGCGSSREHAAWAILDRGFQAVIAVSLARIFEENCYNNALVPIKLEEKIVDEIIKSDEVEVDVENQVVKYDSKEVSFDLDPLKKQFILKGGFMKFLDSKVPGIQTWAKEHSKV